MGLIKLFILLVLIFVAFTFWRQRKAWQADKRRASPAAQQPAKMVRCSQCQLHLPERLAIRHGDDWYCCIEHRDADKHD